MIELPDIGGAFYCPPSRLLGPPVTEMSQLNIPSIGGLSKTYYDHMMRPCTL